MPEPGPLPALILEADIPPKAKTLEHEHTVLVDNEDLDPIAYHMARLVICEARREHASAIALLEPRTVDTPNSVVLGVVLVKA